MKKFLLVLILILIVASCLFPPWRYIYKTPNSNIKKSEPVGYSFLAEPPEVCVYSHSGIPYNLNRPSDYKYVKADTIDFDRLGIQLGLLLFLGSCIVFSKYIFPKTQPKPEPAPSDEQLPKKKHKWIAKTLLYLFIIILLAYGTVITILYYDFAPPQPVVKKSRGINVAFLEALEKGEQKPKQGRINHAYVDALMAGAEANEHPEVQENSDTNRRFLLQRHYNIDDVGDGLQINAYGPGVHMNQYGQPVRLWPDFGGVPGEYLQIKPNAYGPGVHMDQYGRPVREYPWP